MPSRDAHGSTLLFIQRDMELFQKFRFGHGSSF